MKIKILLIFLIIFLFAIPSISADLKKQERLLQNFLRENTDFGNRIFVVKGSLKKLESKVYTIKIKTILSDYEKVLEAEKDPILSFHLNKINYAIFYIKLDLNKQDYKSGGIIILSRYYYDKQNNFIWGQNKPEEIF